MSFPHSLCSCLCHVLQKKLHALSLESRQLDSDIAQRRELLDRIDAEAKTVIKVSVYNYSDVEMLVEHHMCMHGLYAHVMKQSEPSWIVYLRQ